MTKFGEIEAIFFKILENLKNTFSDVIRPPEQFWIYEHTPKNDSKWLKNAFEKSHFLTLFGFSKKSTHLLNKLF